MNFPFIMTIDPTSFRAAFKSDWSEPITGETEIAPLTDEEIDRRFDNFDPMRPDLCHISLVPYAWVMIDYLRPWKFGLSKLQTASIHAMFTENPPATEKEVDGTFDEFFVRWQAFITSKKGGAIKDRLDSKAGMKLFGAYTAAMMKKCASLSAFDSALAAEYEVAIATKALYFLQHSTS